MKNQVIPIEVIHEKIILIRGLKVIIDEDLATFYQVSTANLNRAVSRNLERFPEDFMFQLSTEESRLLKRLLGLSKKYGGRRIKPYAFTEQGVAMLASVLNSSRAISMSIQIIRSFVKLRELLLSNEALSRRLKALESKSDEHAKVIVQIINELHTPADIKKNRIGY